jgi:hypothetical protein
MVFEHYGFFLACHIFISYVYACPDFGVKIINNPALVGSSTGSKNMDPKSAKNQTGPMLRKAEKHLGNMMLIAAALPENGRDNDVHDHIIQAHDQILKAMKKFEESFSE